MTVIAFIQDLLSLLRQTVRSWYRSDRIRITPTTGRLLKLTTDDCIVLLSQLYTVTQREVHSSPDGYEVVCRLKGPDSSGSLRIWCRAPVQNSTAAQLVIDGRTIDVCDDDVAVVSSEPAARSFPAAACQDMPEEDWMAINHGVTEDARRDVTQRTGNSMSSVAPW